jgi:FkbM family methyltransferase
VPARSTALRRLAPRPLLRALERRAYRRAAAFAPAGLGGLRLVAPASWAALYADVYEPELTEALRRLVRPGMHCADVGAHLGYVTLLLAQLTGPDGRVVAFEASGLNAQTTRRSVALNGLAARVEVVHGAAIDRDGGRVDLFGGRTGQGTEWTTSERFAAREDGRRRDPAETVPAVSLDARLAGGERLDLIKIDVEGGEGATLAGARRVLREARPVVVLEFHREAGWPAIAELLDAGYGLETIDGEPLAAPQGPDDVPYHLVARPPAP